MHKWIAACLIILILIAHMFMWRSGMETQWKVIFTAINFTAWGIILGPVFLIDKWLDAVKTRNKSNADRDQP